MSICADSAALAAVIDITARICAGIVAGRLVRSTPALPVRADLSRWADSATCTTVVRITVDVHAFIITVSSAMFAGTFVFVTVARAARPG